MENNSTTSQFQGLGVLNYSVIVSMLCLSALIGLYFAWVNRKSLTNEHLLGSRSLQVFPVSISIMASFMSANTLMGIPAEVYQYGTLLCTYMITFFFVVPATVYLFLPVYYNLRINSVYEYLELRFSKTLRTAAMICFVLHMVMYMSVTLYGPSLALSQVTGINFTLCLYSIGIICTLYTTFGGIKAVIWADVFQVFLIFLYLFVVIGKGIYQQRGFSRIFEINQKGQRLEFFNTQIDPTIRDTSWSLVIGQFFVWIPIFSTNQTMVQRYLAIPTLPEARRCIWLSLPFLVLLLVSCGLQGMILYAYYEFCDPITTKRISATDQILPLYIMDSFASAPGIPGLFVAGIFSGSISTLSSGINSLAAVTLEDIIKNIFFKETIISERWSSRFVKLIAIVYGVSTILLVNLFANTKGIYQLSSMLHGLIGGSVLGIFTLGMFFPWSSSIGAVSGVVSGICVTSWIAIKSLSFNLPTKTKPISIEGCDYFFSNNDTLQTLLINSNSSGISWIFRVSPWWYGLIGFTICMTVGLTVSFLVGKQNPEELESKLLSPVILPVYKYFNIHINYERYAKANTDKCCLKLITKNSSTNIENIVLNSTRV